MAGMTENGKTRLVADAGFGIIVLGIRKLYGDFKDQLSCQWYQSIPDGTDV